LQSSSPIQQNDLTVVLPIYNEENGIDELYKRLTIVLEAMKITYDLLFIDDGSRDASYEVLHQLHEQDPRVRVIKFSRNFGHHIAVTAGLDHAHGRAVVLMDSDLQDQPEEIPKLYQKLQEGYDVVYAIRKNKKFSWWKKTTSSMFRWVMKKILRYEIQGGIFRILRDTVVQKVRECRETDRLVIGLINWVGFRQTGIEVEHGARFAGESKYSFTKMLRLALNAVTGFSTLPLRLASYMGILFSFGSFLGILILFYRAFFTHIPVTGWASIMTTVTFFGGVQLLCLGVLGEYIARIFNETRKRPLYVIGSFLDDPNPPNETQSSESPP